MQPAWQSSSVNLLHELPLAAAHALPSAPALTFADETLSYATVVAMIDRVGEGLVGVGVARHDRVAVYLDKRVETVVAAFAAARAGGVFVPINPILKRDQVVHILRDCNVRVLITSAQRLEVLGDALDTCADLRCIVAIEHASESAYDGKIVISWTDLLQHEGKSRHRVIDADMAAIFYTSGSTGKPKGVVLSHRNMVAGAASVAGYLQNRTSDSILSALPLSFDAGFSQLTTGFYAGARVVLLNYLTPRDVLHAIARERITGLTGVPPLWIQLTQIEWSSAPAETLRYVANTGGRMPLATLAALRARLPKTQFFLMYGLTEAFRSTFLPPSEIDRRPGSIGKAIPNAEILVLRADGSPCAPHEPGELVHRGALVAMGYWNDPVKTAERYRPMPTRSGVRPEEIVLTEMAVFSGDTVTMDEEGFIYFVGRQDEMIKTSGYRVSPTEVEEALYATNLIGEAAAFGVDHPTLGQAIAVTVTPSSSSPVDVDRLLAECRTRLPAYMIPAHVHVLAAPLPRNPNGKIDRRTLADEYAKRGAGELA